MSGGDRHGGRCALAAVVLALLIAAPAATAREFRALRPVATAPSAPLPPGAKRLGAPHPLPQATVEAAARKVVEAWNTPRLEAMLGEGFYDRTRLIDAIDAAVPRDARLRLQSVQSVQTLDQYTVPRENGAGRRLVSLVTATVRTQLEFEAADGSRVRREGVSELLLRIFTPWRGR